jgi:hypothetical protein
MFSARLLGVRAAHRLATRTRASASVHLPYDRAACHPCGPQAPTCVLRPLSSSSPPSDDTEQPVAERQHKPRRASFSSHPPPKQSTSTPLVYGGGNAAAAGAGAASASSGTSASAASASVSAITAGGIDPLVWATVRPEDLGGSPVPRLQNLVKGSWVESERYRTLPDPLTGRPLVHVPDTAAGELTPYVESMCACPKSGLHNPFKRPDRYLLYGQVSRRLAELLYQPEVLDFYTHAIQRVCPKSKVQAEGEVKVGAVGGWVLVGEVFMWMCVLGVWPPVEELSSSLSLSLDSNSLSLS